MRVGAEASRSACRWSALGSSLMYLFFQLPPGTRPGVSAKAPLPELHTRRRRGSSSSPDGTKRAWTNAGPRRPPPPEGADAAPNHVQQEGRPRHRIAVSTRARRRSAGWQVDKQSSAAGEEVEPLGARRGQRFAITPRVPYPRLAFGLPFTNAKRAGDLRCRRSRRHCGREHVDSRTVDVRQLLAPGAPGRRPGQQQLPAPLAAPGRAPSGFDSGSGPPARHTRAGRHRTAARRARRGRRFAPQQRHRLRAAATSRAAVPAWSKVGATGSSRPSPPGPKVNLKPTTSRQTAGIRIEPPVSVPRPSVGLVRRERGRAAAARPARDPTRERAGSGRRRSAGSAR